MQAKPGFQFFQRVFSLMVIASMVLACGVSTPQTADPTVPPPGGQLSKVPVVPLTEAPTGVPTGVSIAPRPVIPTPPPLAPLPAGDPIQQAQALSAALTGGLAELPAWLRLYDMLGIPVIGEDGLALGTTGDDLLGPRYWLVWYSAALNQPGRGISLTDVGRMLAYNSPGVDVGSLGQALLADLRQAVESTDGQVQLLGEFIRQRGLSAGMLIDLLDPAATPETITVDAPAAMLLFWVMLRQFAYTNLSLAGSPAKAFLEHPAGSLVRVSLRPAPRLQSQPPCSQVMGDEDVTYWINWLGKQFTSGGLHLPGMQNPLTNLLQILQENLGRSDDQIKSFGNKLAAAGAITGTMNLLMQVLSLDVSMVTDVDQLVRNKRSSEGDGKSMVITWALVSDPGKLPDGNNTALCFLSTLSSAFGAQVSMPASGRISGAEILFEGAAGFDRVMFGDYKQIRAFTDQFGEVDLKIIGRAQKRDYPDNAAQDTREFSVRVSAQPEGAGMNSIINMFLNGLSFGAGGMEPGLGVLGPIIDTLKLVRYSLGEYYFPLVDWKARGFKVVGAESSGGSLAASGVICSIEEPFEIQVAFEGGSAMFQFVPASAVGGSHTYAGGGSGVTVSGTGSYTLAGVDSDAPAITATSFGCTNLGGQTCRTTTDTFHLAPLGDEDCN